MMDLNVGGEEGELQGPSVLDAAGDHAGQDELREAQGLRGRRGVPPLHSAWAARPCQLELAACFSSALVIHRRGVSVSLVMEKP